MKKEFLITCEKCVKNWCVSDNSGRAICLGCEIRPEGEPEVSRGDVWFGPEKANVVVPFRYRRVTAIR
jgi:hypothetical protein